LYGDVVGIDIINEAIVDFDDESDIFVNDLISASELTSAQYIKLVDRNKTPYPNNFGTCTIEIESGSRLTGDTPDLLSDSSCMFDEPTTAENVLCDEDEWNIMKGTWTFDKEQCILSQTQSGSDDLVWFGSSDGIRPNGHFVHPSFEMTVTMSIEERQHKSSLAWSASGFLLRASQSLKHPQGPDYWIMLYPTQSRLVFAQQNDVQIFSGPKWIKLGEKNLPFKVQYGHKYTIKLIASGDASYDISISDGEKEYLIYDNFKKATDLNIGSIGLRSYYAASTYYSVNYTPL